MLVHVPSEPSRHRVAVWRELRRFGAVPIGRGAWTAPDVPACREGAEKAKKLAHAGAGELLVLPTGPNGDAARLLDLFTAARASEWAEFVADCGKFMDQIDREIAKKKFTLTELEEAEQGLDRLRRWFRAIREQDVFGSPAAQNADQEFTNCIEALDGFAALFYGDTHS